MIAAIKRKSIFSYIVLIIVPIMGMAGSVGLSFAFGINGQPTGDLLANIGFLLAVGSLIPIFKFSTVDLGLKLNTSQMGFHIGASLIIFLGYMLFYIFVIRISALKPFSASTLWGLLTYLIAVIAEEIYFRGALYRFFEKRFSGRTALIVTSLLFGLFHARQGLSGILSRMTTGFLWGSIRYSTRMIFLIIFPIHFMYNATWLLFEGNWNNPPIWAIYTLPLIEFVLGLVIVFLQKIIAISDKG